MISPSSVLALPVLNNPELVPAVVVAVVEFPTPDEAVGAPKLNAGVAAPVALFAAPVDVVLALLAGAPKVKPWEDALPVLVVAEVEAVAAPNVNTDFFSSVEDDEAAPAPGNEKPPAPIDPGAGAGAAFDPALPPPSLGFSQAAH